jgi:hypothetical protein
VAVPRFVVIGLNIPIAGEGMRRERLGAQSRSHGQTTFRLIEMTVALRTFDPTALNCAYLPATYHSTCLTSHLFRYEEVYDKQRILQCLRHIFLHEDLTMS